MKWEVFPDHDSLSDRAASLLLSHIREHPSAVLGLPTGGTPEGMYRRVVANCSREYHCFAGVTTFNLDEYVGIPRDHPASYYTYMRTHLFDHVDLNPAHIHLPDAASALASEDRAAALQRACREYEEAIKAAGGLEVTFLGLGGNGHIGFNEPGAPFDSRTHVVTLADSTRRANARYFPDGRVPEQAITMGIATILESKRIIVLASGPTKVEAVRRLRAGVVEESFPASALHLHPSVTMLVDEVANGSAHAA
jgi:glucosamine-6-phosphate deaminase